MNTLAEDHTNNFIKENEISKREIEEEITLGQVMQMISHQQTDLVNREEIGNYLPPFSPSEGVANTWENWNRTNLIEMWNWHLVDRFYEENLSVEFKDIFKVFNFPTYTFEKQKWALIPNKIEIKEQVIKYQDNLKKDALKK